MRADQPREHWDAMYWLRLNQKWDRENADPLAAYEDHFRELGTLQACQDRLEKLEGQLQKLGANNRAEHGQDVAKGQLAADKLLCENALNALEAERQKSNHTPATGNPMHQVNGAEASRLEDACQRKLSRLDISSAFVRSKLTVDWAGRTLSQLDRETNQARGQVLDLEKRMTDWHHATNRWETKFLSVLPLVGAALRSVDQDHQTQCAASLAKLTKALGITDSAMADPFVQLTTIKARVTEMEQQTEVVRDRLRSLQDGHRTLMLTNESFKGQELLRRIVDRQPTGPEQNSPELGRERTR